MSDKHHSKTYNHILKYTGLFGGIQGLGILVGIVRNKLVAVLLGPDGMGLVSLFNSTVSLMSNSTNFGISMSAVRNLSEAYGSGDEDSMARSVAVVRLWSLVAALLGMVACVVVSPWLSWFTFSWDGHTLHFILLAPVVGMTAITGGELAVMKALRQLRFLANISIINMMTGLAISVPVYYFFGNAGIVPSLVLLAAAQMVSTVAFSYKVCSPRLTVARKLWRNGYGMVRLGVAFVIAGVMGSGAEFLIRSYMNNVAQIETVGLYNAGYMLTMTYVGMVFSAMETDYFPRLSTVNHLGVTFNTTVSRQAEVMLLIVAPLLVAFTVSLPILIPLLFSSRFVPITGMVRVVILAMYLRALMLPVQYVPLAKGDSRSYMLLEAIADCSIVIGVIGFFHLYGLVGAGVGLLVASVVDTVATYVYARWKYGYTPSRMMIVHSAILIPIGIAALWVTTTLTGWGYWVAGALLMIASGAYSLSRLIRK